MKYIEGKTIREKILLIGLIVSFVLGGYLMIRIKPINGEIAKTENIIKKEKSKYQSLLSNTKGVKPSSSLKKEIVKLEKELEKEKQILKGLNLSLVDLNNQEAVHALIKEITVLAEKHNLQILAKKNEVMDLVSMIRNSKRKALQNTQANNRVALQANKVIDVKNNETLNRHMFSLTLRGTFSTTYSFMKSLSELEHSVLITRIKMFADDLNTFNGKRLVNSEFMLAI